MNNASPSLDRIRGALLGTAVGDALGMPVEGLSHQNVRTYYKGIKAYRDDEKRGDLRAGQWTDDTQFTFALARALTAHARTSGRPPRTSKQGERTSKLPGRVAEAYVALRLDVRRWGPTTRRAVERLAQGASWEEAGRPGGDGRPGERIEPTDGAAMRAAPLGAWWAASRTSTPDAFAAFRPVFEITHTHPAAVAAGFGQAFAVREALLATPDAFDQQAFWAELTKATGWAEGQLGGDGRVSRRLRDLAAHLDDFPLDLQDRCNGTGVLADEAWPFAAAMFARGPELVEATLLSTINVGGDADTTGAMAGALLGALHGWSAFPESWREGLEDVRRLEREAEAFAEALSAFGV